MDGVSELHSLVLKGRLPVLVSDGEQRHHGSWSMRGPAACPSVRWQGMPYLLAQTPLPAMEREFFLAFTDASKSGVL